MDIKNSNIIFDFDSTIIQVETIEVLAKFALKNKKNKNEILDEVKELTHLAMNGKIPFDEALNKRISLLKINKSHINDAIQILKNKLSKSFIENLDFIQSHINDCFIVSGGFKEIILEVLKPYGFKQNNIFANSFTFNKYNIVNGVDSKNPLSQDKGKNIASQNIKGYNIIIGDGFTDYEIKKYNNAKIFILFTENIFRKKLNKKADYVAANFYQAFDYIKNVRKK